MLAEGKVVCESHEVGSGCIVREGRLTHTHGRLAAFGKDVHTVEYCFQYSIHTVCH